MQQTTFPTSRGTFMRKKIAEIIEADFTAKDLINLKGSFIADMFEMYRYLGMSLEMAHVRDVFVVNAENIMNECLDEIKASLNKCNIRMQDTVNEILPKNNTNFEPVILDASMNIEALTWEILPQPTLKIKYTISPYEEVEVEAE